MPKAELLCSGKYARHRFVDSSGKNRVRCVRCGARNRNLRRTKSHGNALRHDRHRPRIAPEEQARLLDHLAEVAAARMGTLQDVEELRREEEERHREILRVIQEGHEEANDSLVRLFDLMYDRGVPKMLMYERIGLSPARVISLRRAADRRDRRDEDKEDETHD